MDKIRGKGVALGAKASNSPKKLAKRSAEVLPKDLEWSIKTIERKLEG